VRGEQEDEGGMNSSTTVSDNVETPAQSGRHASLEGNGKQDSMIERVEQMRGPSCDRGRERSFGD